MSWRKWKDALIIVKPDTVARWQRKRLRKYWAGISCRKGKPGRKPTRKEIRNLIYRMAGDNNWGAPRIYSERLMLGCTDVSQATVSRYQRKIRSNDPEIKKKQQSWLAFFKKPSGSNCGHGLLCRSDHRIRHPLRLFRYRTRQAQNPSFQCDPESFLCFAHFCYGLYFDNPQELITF